MKNVIFFLASLLMISALPAQQTSLKLTLKDLNTHREIEGVNVFLSGSNKGAVSDKYGQCTLVIPQALLENEIIVRHIAYHELKTTVQKLQETEIVYLQPRVIPLQGVEVEGLSEAQRINLDIPQTVQVLDAKSFEIRGFVDAGDLLKTDHSVQVEEDLTGRKTIAIRGGNADEVVVLYNGVKLNSALDNVFDMSLIDLEDVDKVEIVRGSNTAIYGPDAFSGVVNIVPKVDVDYTVRFQQRLGTYRSGNWGLHLHRKIGKLSSYYSFKKGGFERKIISSTTDGVLENFSDHHTGHMVYEFAPNKELSSMVVVTDQEFQRTGSYDEGLESQNVLTSLRYRGDLSLLRDIDFSASWRELDENQILTQDGNPYNRGIADQTFYLNLQKSQDIRAISLLLGYQLQHANLDYENQRAGLGFERQHHGFLAIAKTEDEPGSDFFRKMKLSLSVRQDIINDTQTQSVSFAGGDEADPIRTNFQDKRWQESTAKIAMNLHGYSRNLIVDSYITFGANVKFPTLIQQISSPNELAPEANFPTLEPEKNRSFEMNISAMRDMGSDNNVAGWRVSGSYFQNYYDNKFRLLTAPGFLIPFYDNVNTANIKGFEGASEIFLLKKKISSEFGISKYFISEKSSFPFKSDLKQTINVNINHYGYSLQLHWYREGAQIAWLRGSDNLYSEFELEGYSNIDVHLSKSFSIYQMEFFLNFSGRNLIDVDFMLEGLALRDRRFYITFGTQL